MKIIFNSSLPRSGSTLLQNILAQNPRIHCSPTSAVLELLYAARQNFTALDEFKTATDRDAMTRGWLNFCRHGLEGFYGGVTSKPIACDKSRGWMYYYDWLTQFQTDPKLICCVRDVRAIIASMEKLHRKNMHLHDPADKPNEMKMITLESRVSHWLSNPPIGLGLMRLRDAVAKKNSARFYIVQYDALMNEPETVFKKLYAYLGEPEFTHDFSNITQLTTETDGVYGVYGSHKVRQTIDPVKPDWNDVLGRKVGDQLATEYGWVAALKNNGL